MSGAGHGSGEGNGVVGAGLVTPRSTGLVAAGAPEAPDPEVRPKGRRNFTTAYKVQLLEQADRCAPGELGALLRREGLYSSHLTDWRRQRAAGLLGGRRGKAERPEQLHEMQQRLTKVERENRRLRHQLEQAQTIIEVQKKLSALLEIKSPEAGT